MHMHEPPHQRSVSYVLQDFTCCNWLCEDLHGNLTILPAFYLFLLLTSRIHLLNLALLLIIDLTCRRFGRFEGHVLAQVGMMLLPWTLLWSSLHDGCQSPLVVAQVLLEPLRIRCRL